MHGTDAAVHRQDLAGDVLAGRAGEQDGGALEVVIIAEAAQRRLLGQRVLTMDMNNPEPQQAPMSAFRLSTLPGKLRAAGGV